MFIYISTIIFAVAILLFCWSCYKRFRLLMLGKSVDRFKDFGPRLKNVIFYVFGQRCTVNHGYRFGWNHLVLFWSFMFLLIANTEFLFEGLFPDSVSFSMLPVSLYILIEIASVLALLAVCIAMLRRLAFPPSYIEARSMDAFVILGLIALLMVAFFGLHASEIAKGELEATFMPVSNFVASTLFSDVKQETLNDYIEAFWWLHAIVLLAFLNYLPYSKHMHILTGIPNVFFKSLTKVNTQIREDFKKGNVFGVGQINLFTWKDLMDSYSCTECGRCSDNCPATNTGKSLNPRLVIHDIKANLLKNGPFFDNKKAPVLPLIGKGGEGSVSEEVLWSCTTCGACMEVCPVSIEHVPKIVDMRRNLVEMNAKMPGELLTFFESMEQRSNPWGIVPSDRVKWATDITVKPFEAGKTEYLFYVGCFGAFDARSRKVSLAISKILDAGGISWGILGKDELCCGDSMRRLGNEFVFDRMTKDNIKILTDKGIKKIITQCPHCFNTLKNDYRQYGLELEVIHHTELINNLIKAGKLPLNVNGADLGNVVIHDSCYLGRYNGLYDVPREVISSVTGRAATEMDRCLEKSFCCGAGGGRMWMEEEGKRINVTRVEEALKKDPKTVCVSCPYCLTMFEDGLKSTKADDKVQVLDVAEIVSMGLK
ncbi:MAG: (Fe-S)-binding protein [Candidatus Methanoperedens sp.]|nr:(Fe-S)-binding protein [Candidatus Methanoperedens sp.]